MLQVGPLSQSLPGHQCLVFYFMSYFSGLPAQSPVGEREAGRPMRGPGWKTAGRSPQGLIETPAPKGSCGAVAGSACFLHVLLTSEAVPMNVI